ncbi:hypothetical protein B0H17DRAFT_1197162 [Mycena rosella]|uniref:Uncharacterized protein n=1 Tax=Mycena rosella TaxID=1033263 RepID=A0AAD7GPH5_MYCRO|nr:hypothetical protein B0H17DRAFT_1197162 [Mycena rosella]
MSTMQLSSCLQRRTLFLLFLHHTLVSLALPVSIVLSSSGTHPYLALDSAPAFEPLPILSALSPEPTPYYRGPPEAELPGPTESILVAVIIFLTLFVSALLVGVVQFARIYCRASCRDHIVQSDRQYLLVRPDWWPESCEASDHFPPPPYLPRPPSYQDYHFVGGVHKDDVVLAMRMESPASPPGHGRRHSM